MWEKKTRRETRESKHPEEEPDNTFYESFESQNITFLLRISPIKREEPDNFFFVSYESQNIAFLLRISPVKKKGRILVAFESYEIQNIIFFTENVLPKNGTTNK